MDQKKRLNLINPLHTYLQIAYDSYMYLGEDIYIVNQYVPT